MKGISGSKLKQKWSIELCFEIGVKPNLVVWTIRQQFYLSGTWRNKYKNSDTSPTFAFWCFNLRPFSIHSFSLEPIIQFPFLFFFSFITLTINKMRTRFWRINMLYVTSWLNSQHGCQLVDLYFKKKHIYIYKDPFACVLCLLLILILEKCNDCNILNS